MEKKEKTNNQNNLKIYETKDFHKAVKGLFSECMIILMKKNKDYNTSEDAFENFKRVETLNLCSTETGILVRMNDKFSRLCNLIKCNESEVKDETVEDTLIDLINYSAILYCYLKQKRGT